MTTLAELVIEVDVDADRVGVRVSKAAQDVDKAFDKMADRAERSGGRLSKIFGAAGDESGGGFLAGIRSRLDADAAKKVVSMFAGGISAVAGPAAKSAAGFFAAQFIASVVQGLASGAVKVAQGLGAVVALLPAAALAGVTAFAALKIAVSGVGDAISAGLSGDTEAFNEALEGLSPSAREFARGVAGLRDELDGLKGTVQESFFKPFADSVEPLAGRYLPMIEGTLGGIANGFGRAADQVGNFLLLPSTSKALAGALGDVEGAVGNVTGGLSGLAPALLPLITVGASFLPGLTSGFDSATVRLASFMQEAERTGRLREFISDGLSAIGDLVDTGQQLWRIFTDIAGIGRKVFSAAGISGGGLLDTIERLVDQANRFLETAEGSKILGQVFEGLRLVAGILGGKLALVGKILGGLFGPIMPQVLGFLKALGRLADVVTEIGLEALEPILAGLGAVLGNVVLPGLTTLANLLADNQPVLQGIGIAITTLLVPAFIAWAISAGTAALATLLAMAPLILLGAAIAALATLVIIHFDTIKRWISNVFNWVKENWPLLLAILTAPFGLAVLAITRNWDSIKAGASAAKQWIVDRFNSVVSFFTGMPGRITSAALGMFDGLKSAFKSAVNAIIRWWNGLSFTLPTIDIPGFDPPGPGPSFGGASIGGQTFSTPNIPQLGDGAILKATAGGVPFLGAERGYDEAVVPLPRGLRNLGMGGGRPSVTINVAGSIRSDRDLVELVRDELVRGGFGGAFG